MQIDASSSNTWEPAWTGPPQRLSFHRFLCRRARLRGLGPGPPPVLPSFSLGGSAERTAPAGASVEGSLRAVGSAGSGCADSTSSLHLMRFGAARTGVFPSGIDFPDRGGRTR